MGLAVQPQPCQIFVVHFVYRKRHFALVCGQLIARDGGAASASALPLLFSLLPPTTFTSAASLMSAVALSAPFLPSSHSYAAFHCTREKCEWRKRKTPLFRGTIFPLGNPHLQLGPLVSSGSSSPISANTRSKGSKNVRQTEVPAAREMLAALFRFCASLCPMFPVVVCF